MLAGAVIGLSRGLHPSRQYAQASAAAPRPSVDKNSFLSIFVIRVVESAQATSVVMQPVGPVRPPRKCSEFQKWGSFRRRSSLLKMLWYLESWYQQTMLLRLLRCEEDGMKVVGNRRPIASRLRSYPLDTSPFLFIPARQFSIISCLNSHPRGPKGEWNKAFLEIV